MSNKPNRRFRPAPSYELALWGGRFAFREHPAAPGLVFAQEGGRGVVYQVAEVPGGSLFGLKVFAAAYRVSRLANSRAALDALGERKGLKAAHRRVLLPSDPAVALAPDLAYAVLMPWIRGKTWYDCLQTAEVKQQSLHSQHVGMRFALDFLEVMTGLEAASIAHTDISPGNVTLDPDTLSVELVDLEDIYFPGASEPEKTSGTPGYQHHKKRHTWRPEGDRYATAILTSEILLLSDDEVARRTTTSGFYGEDCTQPEGRERFEMAMPRLRRQCPAFAELFERAWFADELAACPQISELRSALLKDSGNRTTDLRDDGRRLPPVLPPAEPGPAKAVWGRWEQEPTGGWSLPTKPAHHSSPSVGSMFEDTSARSSGAGWWIAVVLIALIALMLAVAF